VTQPTAAGRASTSASGGTVSSSQGGVGGQATAAGGGGSTTAGSSGVAGAAGSSTAGSAAAGSGAPIGGAMDLDALACIVSPAMTPGPFFVEEKLDRSNLVMGETDPLITMAVPLHLTLGVFKVDGMACSPMSGVQVDIWHANANGLYSDVSPGAVQSTDTKGKKYLRGFQTTSATGVVTFETIYPGWYPSRTIHIHFKLRMPGSGNTMYDFTSQMFFDESVSKTVLATAPYTSTKGTRSVFNEDDDVYNGTKVNGMAPGAFTLVKLTDMKPGYSGVLKIGVKM
jgi:protocatechuate 3,4-dioxygenase beta subunit